MPASDTAHVVTPLAQFLPMSGGDRALLWEAFGKRLAPCLEAKGAEMAPFDAPEDEISASLQRLGERAVWAEADPARAASEGLYVSRQLERASGTGEAGGFQPAPGVTEAAWAQAFEVCWASVRKQVGWEPSEPIESVVSDLMHRALVQLKDDPKAKPVVERWSGCMLDRGYAYQDITNGVTFEGFDFSAPPTPDEVAMAVAVANCTQSTGAVAVLDTRFDVVANRLVDDNRDALRDAAARARRRVQQAKELLADGRR